MEDLLAGSVCGVRKSMGLALLGVKIFLPFVAFKSYNV